MAGALAHRCEAASQSRHGAAQHGVARPWPRRAVLLEFQPCTSRFSASAMSAPPPPPASPRPGTTCWASTSTPTRSPPSAPGARPWSSPMVEELLSAGVGDGRVQSAAPARRRSRPARHGDHLRRHAVARRRQARPVRICSRARASSARRCGQRRAAQPLLLVFRSTMPPGTMERLVLPTLARAAGRAARAALRGRLQSRVPARGDGRQGLFRPAQDRRSASASPASRGGSLGIYDGIDGTVVRGAVPGGRDGQVRRQ